MSVFKKMMRAMFGTPEEPTRVVILGLDAAGKTTILYKLRGSNDAIVDTYPTIGFNVETLERQDVKMTCWDVGGCDKIKPLWRHFCENMAVLMFVIDSNDRDRLSTAGEELSYFLDDDTVASHVPVLIMANKQDFENAMPASEITEKLQLRTKLKGRQWHVIPCCATDGAGISGAVEWIKEAVRDKTYSLHPAEDSTLPDAPSSSSSSSSSSAGLSFNFNKSVAEEVAAAKAKARQANRRDTLEYWVVLARKELAEAGGGTLEGVAAADAAFLAGVENATLDSWDHYTHIKLGYLVLTSGVSREEATLRVCQLISSFIGRSNRTNGRSYHCTMTHFWCHMIALQLSKCSGSSTVSKGFVGFMESLQSDDAVELWDGKLFAQYYSNGTMFSGEARSQFVSPDLKPLPVF